MCEKKNNWDTVNQLNSENNKSGKTALMTYIINAKLFELDKPFCILHATSWSANNTHC